LIFGKSVAHEHYEPLLYVANLKRVTNIKKNNYFF